MVATAPTRGSDLSDTIQHLIDGQFEAVTLADALTLTGSAQEELFSLARLQRATRFAMGQVEVRSVIEVSNVCRQRCNYCSIGSSTRDAEYVISHDDFLEIVGHVHSRGRRCLLVQSGENRSPDYVDSVVAVVGECKRRFADLTIILCLGNLRREHYRALREAGADRYILKFETSNPELYQRSKPNDTLARRVDCLRQLLDLGFEVGTGNIVGLPGQTAQDLVGDLQLLNRLPLTMMSCSAFIPGEETPYRDQPPGDLARTLNFMALMRIMHPAALIPTTSSLEKIQPGGQHLGLLAGANAVTIHDGTPARLKEHFPIYSTNRFVPDEEHIFGIIAKAGLVCKGL